MISYFLSKEGLRASANAGPTEKTNRNKVKGACPRLLRQQKNWIIRMETLIPYHPAEVNVLFIIIGFNPTRIIFYS